MVIAGRTLWISGVLLFLGALFLYSPTVSSGGLPPSISRDFPGLSASLPRETVNLQRLQTQQLFCLAGLTLFLAGIFLDAIGLLRRQVIAIALRGTAWDLSRHLDTLTTEEYSELGITHLEDRDLYQLGQGEAHFTNLEQAVRYAREKRLL